ncbi:MAG: hypothetical protein IH899_15710 [Planctomycetes bacterium]|nr:hypothetical protein [Planctomycetota bacterium]
MFRYIWNMEDSPLKKQSRSHDTLEDVHNHLAEYFLLIMEGSAEAICRLILEACQEANDG